MCCFSRSYWKTRSKYNMQLLNKEQTKIEIVDPGNGSVIREKQREIPGNPFAASLEQNQSTLQLGVGGGCLEGKSPRKKYGINRPFNRFDHVENCTNCCGSKREESEISKQTKQQSQKMNNKKNIIRLYCLAWQ